MLVVGVVAAVACLWLILSWEPVTREEPLDNAFSQPEPAAAPDLVPPPAAAAQPEQPAPPAAAAAEPEPEPEPEPAPTEPPPTGFKLEQAVPEKVEDMAHLPPPSSSGPLADLQKEFESAARDTDSARVESVIAEAFKLQHVPPELLESATCQGGICRVRTRWTPERAGGFTIAVTTLAVKVPGEGQDTLMFDRNIAVGPASDRNSNGERVIDVYLRKHNKK
jgi:hypothetical protein